MRNLLVLFIALSLGCASTSSPSSSSSSSSDASTDAAQPDSSEPELDGAAQSGDAAPADDAATADASDGGGGSRASYAVKTVIDVWWRGESELPMIDPGRGFITLFHKLEVADACEDGVVAQTELVPCGIAFPPYTSWAMCGAFQVEAPASLWTSTPRPHWNADDVLERDDRPSVPLTLGKLGQSYRETGCGINGEHPLRFWGLPTSANATVLCEPTGEGPGGCPVAVDLRARLTATLSPWSDQCTSDDSRVTSQLVVNGIELGLELCDLMDGVACSAEQLDFVEQSAIPTYKVLATGSAPPPAMLASPCDCSGGCAGAACPLDQTPSLGTRSAIVRLSGDSAPLDCEAVRNAAEAAYPGADL